jgi:hypothetical protein
MISLDKEVAATDKCVLERGVVSLLILFQKNPLLGIFVQIAHKMFEGAVPPFRLPIPNTATKEDHWGVRCVSIISTKVA